jgi:hypothetical protein
VRVNVRIDTLALDGIELTRRERDALGPALERELALVVRGGLAVAPADAAGSRIDGIARRVAIAVHGSVPALGARRVRR